MEVLLLNNFYVIVKIHFGFVLLWDHGKTNLNARRSAFGQNIQQNEAQEQLAFTAWNRYHSIVRTVLIYIYIYIYKTLWKAWKSKKYRNYIFTTSPLMT